MSLLHLASDEFAFEKGRIFEADDEAVIYKNRLYQDISPSRNDLDDVDSPFHVHDYREDYHRMRHDNFD